MENIGIDVHKKESQLCILTESGQVLEQRISTRREKFEAVLKDRPRARVLMEASTESEWVARCIEALGHEVIVADPNFAAMYATRSRKVKTDRRDARTLADAAMLGAFRPAHRVSDAQRDMRARLGVREALVTTRARYISLIGALVRQHGWRVETGSAKHFLERLARVPLTKEVREAIAPLVSVMSLLDQQIAAADEVISAAMEGNPQARRLMTAPAVGAITAANFLATVDDAGRFENAHQVQSYFGLVPREMSSGEKQRKGHITKAGNTRMRRLMVQAAITTMRMHDPDSEHLRQWAINIALRRGRRIAMVALARKLCGVLYAMLRDGTEFGRRTTRSAGGVSQAAA